MEEFEEYEELMGVGRKEIGMGQESELDQEFLETVQESIVEENEEELEQEPEIDQKEKEMSQGEAFKNIRLLLNDYPNDFIFKGFEQRIDCINSLLLIYDLLTYCKYKTVKDELKLFIEKELVLFSESINLEKLRGRYFDYKEADLKYSKIRIKNEILNLIKDNYCLISDKIQYYSLIIPSKKFKTKFHKSTVGWGASGAEEYEQKEIEEGKEIDPNKPFKLDEEGKITQVE